MLISSAPLVFIIFIYENIFVQQTDKNAWCINCPSRLPMARRGMWACVISVIMLLLCVTLQGCSVVTALTVPVLAFLAPPLPPGPADLDLRLGWIDEILMKS